jgi:hypothetical protein
MKKFPFPRNLFWDTEIKNINLKKHKQYVIERVLTRGGEADIKKLLALYTKTQISFAVRNSSVLDPKARNFCSTYFNIPTEEMYVSDFYN